MTDLYARLKALLEPYNSCHVECDGFAQIAHRVLIDNQIDHTAYAGQLRDPATGRSTTPHIWIEVPDPDAHDGGWRVDYRARLWLGEVAPHGIASVSETAAWYPMRRATRLNYPNDTVFHSLTMDWGTIVNELRLRNNNQEGNSTKN